MWGSALIEDDFGDPYIVGESLNETPIIKKEFEFSINGDGWFETHMNCNADSLVKRLRKARRYNKDNKDEKERAIIFDSPPFSNAKRTNYMDLVSSLIEGKVEFKKRKSDRTFVSVKPN